MKKFKFGILDVIIIVFLIVAIVLTVGYFSNSSKEVIVKVPDVTYKVELKSVPLDIVDLFKTGDKIKDSVKGGALGTVIDVDVHDNIEIREDTINDKFVTASFSNKKDIILTIKGKPTTFDKKHIRFASVNVKVGEMIYIATDKYSYSGYIIEMEADESAVQEMEETK